VWLTDVAGDTVTRGSAFSWIAALLIITSLFEVVYITYQASRGRLHTTTPVIRFTRGWFGLMGIRSGRPDGIASLAGVGNLEATRLMGDSGCRARCHRRAIAHLCAGDSQWFSFGRQPATRGARSTTTWLAFAQRHPAIPFFGCPCSATHSLDGLVRRAISWELGSTWIRRGGDAVRLGMGSFDLDRPSLVSGQTMKKACNPFGLQASSFGGEVGIRTLGQGRPYA